MIYNTPPLHQKNQVNIIQQLASVRGFKYYFLAFWAVLAVFQAMNTALIDDETYYWVYAENIEWGHFHQPPMVALMIKIGYFLFPTAFGVRLMAIVLHLLTLVLIERMLAPKHDLLFAAIIIAIVPLHLAGYWAVPDTPFLFFVALFFYCTQQYLARDSWQLMLLLAVVVAGMFYSKYHSIVIIVATMLANLNLFKRWSFYGIGIIALLLFLPHLYWQWTHDFVSVQFHWTERMREMWRINLTLEYLLGILGLFGPIIGVILLWKALSFTTTTAFQKTLKYNLVGIIGFFLMMSFRGRVEVNWALAGVIPLVILAHNSLLRSPKWLKWVYYTLPFSIALAIFGRFIIIYDVLPKEKVFMKLGEFHDWEAWADAIEQKAGDLPVVFSGGYQLASRYQFHTKKMAHNLSPVGRAKTQYDLYPFGAALQGKKVFHVWSYGRHIYDTIQTPKGVFQYKVIPEFRSYEHVKVVTPQKVFEFPPDSEVIIPIKLESEQPIDFGNDPDLVSRMSYQIFKYRQTVLDETSWVLAKYVQEHVQKEGDWYDFKIKTPKEKGTYQMNISIKTGHYFPNHNSPRFKLVIR